jgi:hypothetical protein
LPHERGVATKNAVGWKKFPNQVERNIPSLIRMVGKNVMTAEQRAAGTKNSAAAMLALPGKM